MATPRLSSLEPPGLNQRFRIRSSMTEHPCNTSNAHIFRKTNLKSVSGSLSMTRDRSAPSFSVEIRNGRKREPLKRKWQDGLAAKIPKRTRDEDSSVPSVAQGGPKHATTSRAMNGSLVSTVEPPVHPKGRVLPDLSSLNKNATTSQDDKTDLAVKPKRRYRQKALSASPAISQTVNNGARPQAPVDGDTIDPAPIKPALLANANFESEAIAEAIKSPSDKTRRPDLAEDEQLRPGERWKRRLSKYSR